MQRPEATGWGAGYRFPSSLSSHFFHSEREQITILGSAPSSTLSVLKKALKPRKSTLQAIRSQEARCGTSAPPLLEAAGRLGPPAPICEQ